MQYCLGISIDDKFVRYAKVKKEDNDFKVESYGINAYSNLDLEKKIKQIVQETNCNREDISIDIQNEKYYFFNFFGVKNKTYTREAVETEFESFCTENHINKNTVDGRYIYTKNIDTPDQNKAIYIYQNKGEIEERLNLFKGLKVVSATPDAISIPNIANIEANKNIMIVDIGDTTKITTIINKNIYNIDILSQGLKEAFDTINLKENSILKTYEVLKNTTIYTMDMDVNSTGKNDEYLQYIVPALYKTAQEIVNITKNYKRIDQIYLTGYATVINNIELYFQEYFKESKVEILKPFFIQKSNGVNIKDYIEVNQAIALALQGMGYGAKAINFSNNKRTEEIKSLLTMNLSDLANLFKVQKADKDKTTKERKKINFNFDLGSLNDRFKKFDSIIIEALISVLIITILYCIGSIWVRKQIASETDKVNNTINYTNEQIAKATNDDAKINTKTSDYTKYKSNLQNTSNIIEKKRNRKNQITTLLNKIVYTIPKEVQLTEIKNEEKGDKEHILISAQSSKYEQLAYFKAKLKNANILDNVTSNEGTKSGDVVTTIIEGDLRDY
jgi:Tfp pilus assembly protein PilN